MAQDSFWSPFSERDSPFSLSSFLSRIGPHGLPKVGLELSLRFSKQDGDLLLSRNGALECIFGLIKRQKGHRALLLLSTFKCFSATMKFVSITLVALLSGLTHASKSSKGGGPFSHCRHTTFGSKQSWSGSGLIIADGTPLATADYKQAGQGASWTFKGTVTDLKGNDIGSNYELSTLADADDIWINEGNYIFEGCDGILTFTGLYTDEGTIPGGRIAQYEAEFAITGGTGVFVGATGTVKSNYDAVNGVSERIITIN